ncbi:hypothetical protein EH227_07220 [Rouxiella chamberiensis]|nr:hypothetical protein EH227_07220 [Rouxiella chamberiensis]
MEAGESLSYVYRLRRKKKHENNNRSVIAVAVGGNDLAKAKEVKTAMVNKVINLQESGRLVSRHCVSEKMYTTRNAFDISTHFSTDKIIQLAFDKALTNYARDNDGFKYISPYKHAGEPAFHVEIEQ